MSLFDRLQAELNKGTVVTARITKKPPCKTCPWRRDVPAGTNALALVEQLRPTNAEDGPPQACHKTAGSKRPTVCAGHLIRVGRSRADIALVAAAHGVSLWEIKSKAPLYESFEEMVQAHMEAEAC